MTEDIEIVYIKHVMKFIRPGVKNEVGDETPLTMYIPSRSKQVRVRLVQKEENEGQDPKGPVGEGIDGSRPRYPVTFTLQSSPSPLLHYRLYLEVVPFLLCLKESGSE